MIALLLAAQLVGVAAANPQVQNFAQAPAERSGELIRVLPRKAVCKGDPAQMEVSLAIPTALYRQGDRPPKGLKNWADYPEGVLCAVGEAK
jgi:hypothetical protein